MNWKEFLVKLSLLKETLDSETIAQHSTEFFHDELAGLDLVMNWRAVMCDRASTNSAAIDLIYHPTHAAVSRKPCNPHTLCKLGRNIGSPEANKALKLLMYMLATINPLLFILIIILKATMLTHDSSLLWYIVNWW
jgi:hypothetical protein